MGFLRRFGRSSEIIDLTDEKEKAALWAEKNRPKMKFQGDFADLTSDSLNSTNLNSSELSNSSSSSESAFSFLDNSSLVSSSSSVSNFSTDSEDVNKKMQIMSRRIEDQSNEIYHLMQKIELLEKKIERIGG
ncbi:MAG TPA: hypothetical protein P5277_01860 [Candidatus Paceibacterota bacterium]|nr:hypothetical protein [Candidatus Paceibacterota bacterium]